MNKVLILREKYPKLNKSTFDLFADSDTTPTVKYLNYYLKTWSNKKGSSFTSRQLIDYVQQYDELLPYIDKKDIYTPFFESFQNLVDTVLKAKQTKEDKTFKRDEHAKVLIDNDDYIFLSPLTYRGSLKYGASTKWCVAASNTDTYFKSYTGKGTLCYLIDKTNTKINGTNKVALYLDGINGNELMMPFTFWNETDKSVDVKYLTSGGWDEDELFKITTHFRHYSIKNSKYVKMKKNVDSTISSLLKLDLDELISNIETLSIAKIGSDYSNEKAILNNFINKIQNI